MQPISHVALGLKELHCDSIYANKGEFDACKSLVKCPHVMPYVSINIREDIREAGKKEGKDH